MTIETIRIVKKLMEIWPNEVCDRQMWGGAITHQVKCNIFFKGYVERARMDVCNLGKTEVILGMLWLAAHNLEID